jgi:hypothetical protein
MALLIAASPAVAGEFLMMEMPAGSPAARSMLLWPPGLSVPDQANFLFDAQGPVAQPYRVRVVWDFWGCEPEGPATGIELAYLIGRSSSPNLAFADPAGQVTGATDASGMTAVVLPLRGGGHGTAADFALAAPNVYCALNYDSGLKVNSPDLDGDLLVNLSDLTLFARDFFGPYNYRSDLQWNGHIDLGDLSYFAVAMQEND